VSLRNPPLYCLQSVGGGCQQTAQQLSLSLEEIKEVLDACGRGNLPCGEVKEKLEPKLLGLMH
jgi:DNA-binding transcriptional MerR regulator